MNDIFALSHELPVPSPKPPEVFLIVDPSPSPEGLPTRLILRGDSIAANESCCCNCGCLPYTVTAVFDSLQDKTHSQHCKISMTSPFKPIDGGAWGVGLAPGGNDPEDRGPLTSVLLVDPGIGIYATIGREPPLLINISGTGKDAVFEPVLVVNPELGAGPTCQVWTIESISVSGGSGYTDGEFLKISPSKYDTMLEFPAVLAQLTTTAPRTEPEVTATATEGQGAQFNVSLQQNNTNPLTWSVSNVEVTNGGTGYFPQYPPIGFTIPLSFSTNGVEQLEANYRAYPAVKLPEDLITETTGSGVGAEFEFIFESMIETYADTFGGPIREALCWHLVGANVLNGGSNYSVNDFIIRTVPGALDSNNKCELVIIEVDENGSIISFNIAWDGRLRESINGSIGGTYGIGGGSYYYAGDGAGIPQSVNVLLGGAFFHSDPDTPSCVIPTAFDIWCNSGQNGEGAEIIAVVDEDARSPTFASILDLKIVDPGSGYLMWGWTQSAHSQLNGMEFVLRANTPKRLVELEIKSCFGFGASAVVENRGPRMEPVLKVDSICGPPTIPVTIEEHSDNDLGCQPYWSIKSIDISSYSGSYCPLISSATIVKECATFAQKEANIDLLAQNGTLIDFVIKDSGKYYKSYDWDGQPAPIYAVSLTSGGEDYAEFARVEPDMELKVSDVYGISNLATFDFDLVEKTDKCGLPYWTVRNITVSGGQNYTEASRLIAIEANPDPDDNISFVEKEPLIAVVHTRSKPNITATIVSEEGSGAEVEIHLSEIKSNPQAGVDSPLGWTISSVSGGGGKDYSDDAHIELDLNGAIGTIAAEFDITIQRGVITCISIIRNGLYYLDDGIPKRVKLYNGGKYFSRDKDGEPYVADVEVLIKQKQGSNGYGAVIEAIVEDDTESDGFGGIKELIIKDCGQNYSYFGGPLDCKYRGWCKGSCEYHGYPQFNVTMPGASGVPMKAQLVDFSCDALVDINFKSENNMSCTNPFPATGLLWWGAESGNITINAGGIWDSIGTDNCPKPSCPPTTTTTTVTTMTPMSVVNVPLAMDIESNIKTDQKISFISNIKCGNKYLSGSGTLDNISMDGVWIKDNVLYHTNIFIDIKCEKFTYDNNEYEYKYQVILWLVNPDSSNLLDVSEWSPNKSKYTTKIIKKDDGYLNGSVKVYDDNGYYVIVNLE